MTHWHNKPHKQLKSIPVPVAAELLGPEPVTLLLGLTPLLVCVAGFWEQEWRGWAGP